jgi:predicted AAA+ superfamily ATPase
VLWLTGVRRVGKTTLSLSLADASYYNCDLPSVAEELRDPEQFYRSLQKRRVILDEVHQLSDPSRVLKIAADAFPNLKVLATGSSTLAATQKFRDSLTGRKRLIHLLPVLVEELPDFGVTDLGVRLLRGGLPQPLLSPERDLEFYGEWLDSFYARDVQELFRVEKRTGFLKLLELLLRQSGGLAEMTTLAKYSGLTRPTVANYMEVLQVTHAIKVLRPYSAGGRREIIAQPKVFGFDTGFIAYCRGWSELRNEDRGQLWEHLVLETLLSLPGGQAINFWRDKQRREVDFVLPRGRSTCDAIECKWTADAFELTGLKAFRQNYPRGRNLLISPQVMQPYERTIDGVEVTFGNATHLRNLLTH